MLKLPQATATPEKPWFIQDLLSGAAEMLMGERAILSESKLVHLHAYPGTLSSGLAKQSDVAGRRRRGGGGSGVNKGNCGERR